MAIPSAQSPTVGMQIDAFLEGISHLESIPATHVFVAVIVISITFSFLLLNSGRGSSMAVDETNLEKEVIKPPRKKSETNSDEPQPKWHILKMTNYVVTTVFLVSVIQFISDATAYLNSSNALISFLVIWSACLCYFFGFFGISFIELDDFVDQNVPAGAQQIPTPPQHFMARANCHPEPPRIIHVHPPATSAPICADPTSFKKPTVPPNIRDFSDAEIASLVLQDSIKDHQLEKLLDPHRAVAVRRLKFNALLENLGRGDDVLKELPSQHDLDYKRVLGANCEIVVGYVPIPVGMAGPITLNGESVYIPMATTEGCLVASTNRGCKAITQGSGAISTIVGDGITRAPCIQMPSAREAAEVLLWIKEPANFLKLKESFESTTSFGKLIEASPTIAGRNVYVRLRCFSGDAMGMNMISKGSLAAIECLKVHFPNLLLIALSGNLCTDKKAAAINWIEGRGKSVVIEATIPQDIVRTTLKTSVPAIVETNVNKNLIGSAMASVVGGFNAHAANNVTAVFLATGQDPAQNVESSNCITLMEETAEGDLWISCTMPSIEVGTVGGGTGLPAQSACLKAIGAKGGGINPGDNARQLAHVVAAATIAGELSLMAALASNSLVSAHMAHNRKPVSK